MKLQSRLCQTPLVQLVQASPVLNLFSVVTFLKICHPVQLNDLCVRIFFVAARRGNESTYSPVAGACGCSGRPTRVCSARVAGSDELWQTKENLVSLFKDR